MLPRVRRLKTMMGSLFSMAKLKAVVSMTLKPPFDGFHVGQAGKILGVGVGHRVRVVHAVHLGGFEQNLGPDLAGPQHGGGISREKRISRAGGRK